MAQLERDAAIERTRRTRRWVIAGSAALTAGLAGLVSAVAPGRSLGAGSHAARSVSSSASAGPGSGSTEARMPPLANPSSLGLQGPVQTPQPAPSPSPGPSGPSQSSPGPSQASPSASSPAPVSGGS
ncbi:MAG: hypothetical protein JO181_06535 [Solirubrobacterales bacterium]|nr:hypothetical protein [Solirubrobacterales bacterium]